MSDITDGNDTEELFLTIEKSAPLILDGKFFTIEKNTNER